ncbi:hypothetical protein AKJ41_00160 [candidate division MSBL1 archaeon SCGC-AAA259O05]|uniref:Radical SAM core domain-containing protein n=1 Tax=candidate division MSBL1 archaeon SCGC-AAA259O05 TaxID=1698271 RepID=A0A133V5W3_9EURY|nr:hypothetical protein AKJ41_00160 [candidate division MSBL1 archaeon SCGC-AAA259O05]
MSRSIKRSKTTTDIYHIVHFESDDSIYVFFKKCNFNCRGCIKEKSPWDSHIPDKHIKKLQNAGKLETLDLDGLKKIIDSKKPQKAVLGGGEPTVDENISNIVRILNENDTRTVLLSNGYFLDEEFSRKLISSGLKEACISIKSIDEAMHRNYTSMDNKRVLNNFKTLNDERITLRSESVLIPGLIGTNEIESVADFVSSVNPKIPFRIDPFKEVPSLDYRSPSTEEMKEAQARAEDHLESVSYLNPDAPTTGEVSVLYPNLQEEGKP